MKFLVLIEGIPGVPMPPEQGLALGKANMAWIKRVKETGRVEAAYLLADHAGGFEGGFGIINYESAEQMAEDLATCPVAGLSTFKVYPLVAPEVTEKLIDAALAQLAKKKK
jgi:hypothetical protein